ncbi:hypothetical protein SFRURICE_015324 [Spodoptera frugiperda]|nr:hypothetical protein SFRURICE_015324 [Spodoptera frugiperda]
MTDGRHPPTLRIVRCGLVSMGVDCRITASSGAYATKLRVYYLLKDVLKSQIRNTLKRKAYEDLGIPMREVSSTVTSNTEQAPQPAPAPLSVINRQIALGHNAEVTLNMLNASEIDDADGLSGGVKLEFDPNEDAAT